MDFDANSILFGGFSAVVILVFIVQTIREAFNIKSEQISLIAIAIGLIMFIGAFYLPENLVEAIATGLMVAAAASFTVRFVKNGVNDEYTPRDSAKRIQGNDIAAPRVRSEERKVIQRTLD